MYKVDSEEKDSPDAPARIWTRNLSITSQALYQQAIQAPKKTENSEMSRSVPQLAGQRPNIEYVDTLFAHVA